MSEKKVYGVGFIGFAHVHALNYARGFKNAPETKLVAVADSNVERGKWGAAAVGIEEFYSDPYEMLRKKDISIVCICSETARHAEYAVAAAEAGKHICMEKVLDVTLERADRIIKAAKNAGVKLICPPTPHDLRGRGLKEAKELIDKGYIGKPNLAHWHRGHRGVTASMGGGWGEWFYKPEESGGGALIDYGVHNIYKPLYLFGDAREVTAMIETVYPERVFGNKKITNIQTEDNAVTTIKFKNGVISVADVSFARCADIRKDIVYGTEGTIVLDSSLGDVAVYSNKTSEEWRGWTIPEPFRSVRYQFGAPPYWEVKALIDLIENEENTWRVNGKWARDVLEIVLASYESAKSKRTISLPL